MGKPLYNNMGTLEPTAMKISGITEAELASGITKEAFYNKLKALFKKHKNKIALAGHNIIGFDNKFIIKLFKDFNDDLRDHILECFYGHAYLKPNDKPRTLLRTV